MTSRQQNDPPRDSSADAAAGGAAGTRVGPGTTIATMATARRGRLLGTLVLLAAHHGFVLALFVTSQSVWLAALLTLYLSCLTIAVGAWLFAGARPANTSTSRDGSASAEGSEAMQHESAPGRADAAERAHNAFLANLSHEIRTPLSAVLGSTELLAQEPLSAEQLRMVQTVRSAGHALLRLVDDWLDLSKVEAGTLELEEHEMTVKDVVLAAVESQRGLAARKGLGFESHLEDELSQKVRGDSMRLQQVLSALVAHAVKFTDKGRVELHARVIAREPACVRVRFAIEDTSLGLTADAARRVFDPTAPADDPTVRRYGTSGLGLSIARRLVALMGGALVLRTDPGHGSRFEFEVALSTRAAGAQKSQAEARAASVQRLRAHAPSVLVVEDTEANRSLLTVRLERLGCRVASVEDGARAVALLTNPHSFDLVFMDWHMPVMDGLEAVQRIRSWEHSSGHKRVAIVGYTASAFADDVVRCRQVGMDRVVVKPLGRDELETVLSEMLLQEPAKRSRREPCLDALVIADLKALDSVEPGFLNKLIGGFLGRGPDTLRAIRAASALGGDAEVRRLAHGLRGSAANLGAIELAAALARIEREDPRRSAVEQQALLEHLEQEYERVRVELEALLEACNAATAKASSRSPGLVS